MSERGEALSVCERQIATIGSASYYFGVLPFCVDSISEEAVGYYPLWFPQGKLFVSLVSCVVLVILSVKRS